MADAEEKRVSALLAENEDLRRRLADASRHAAGRISSESRLRQIVESTVDYAIIAADAEGILTDWNEAAETILGWSARQIVGRPIATIFTPEDVEAGVDAREMRFSLTMGKARDERWHLRADGSRFYASGQMTPLVDGEGRHVGFLKILRDRTAEEKNRQELEASRERLRFALDASVIVATWDWDLAADVVYADERFARLFGVDPALGAKGAPSETYADGVHPDDRERIRRAVANAIETAGIFAEEYRVIDTEGAVHVVQARGRSFNSADGRPSRLPGAIVDVTRERLREARQAALMRIGDDLLSSGGQVDSTLKAMEVLGETLGLARTGYAEVDADERYAAAVGQWTRPGIPLLTGQYELGRFGPDLVRELRKGVLVIDDVEAHSVTRDHVGTWRSIEARSLVNLSIVEGGRVRVILFLHDDRPRQWDEDDVGFVRDVLQRSWAFSQRRRAEQALVHAETRLRLAHEAADLGTFDYDLVAGELVWDQRCRAAFGIFDDRPVDFESAFLPGLHPEDRKRTLAEVERVLDPNSDGEFDVLYRTIGREDAVLRWVRASAQTVVEAGRTIRFVGAVRDVTEEKEAEERQLLLTRELQHRVKNTLAMVNALANQTLRRAANAQEGLAAFSARLIALSHAHDILTQTSWTSAPIGAIVAESLATHRGDSAAVTWSGPDVRLTAKQSLALALALHELATNASKYGALSADDGKVTIVWRIVSRPEGPRLAFEWSEHGGPPVVAPAARGFGSRLIEQSLAIEFGGTVELRYDPDGVRCIIDAPMTQDGEEVTVG
ncbi:MAG: PAS domain S-box protein [Rhizobiaceae bacterium]|nr:PAS domain S-box protein [Rhizobiaceae bacterium]